MRRHYSWLLILVAAVALALALPALHTPPAPAQDTAAVGEHRPEAGATQTGTGTAPAASASDLAAYFSRSDDPRTVILSALGTVNKSAIVAMYTFTDRDLAQALVDARGRGAQVTVYLDRSMATSRYSMARYLVAQGVAVRISNNPAIMHNKFAVLDGATVLTGSYNWTMAASRENDENLLWIKRPELAQRYTRQFWRLWEMYDPTLTAGLKGPPPAGGRAERN
jgi:phosphatidylserine/phosphatidylglycerophosphate/cardiolipin synthase-like enzyme